MFKDQTASVARRASSDKAGNSFGIPTREPTPTKIDVARRYFFEHFVTPSHLAFLRDIPSNDLLDKAVLACGFAASANCNGSRDGNEIARAHYVNALSATNAAVRDPRRSKEDSTLVSVLLLGLFERVTWEGHASVQSWRHHLRGAAQILQLRGRTQVRTKAGKAIFRELREHMLVDSLWCEKAVPDYVVQWTEILAYDPINGPLDQLAALAARLAAIRNQFSLAERKDEDITEACTSLEVDLSAWSEAASGAGSVFSFHKVEDSSASRSWNGTRHEYGTPEAHRAWNTWRCLQIFLSRIQEVLWRRSWYLLGQSGQTIPEPGHLLHIRMRMSEDIGVAAACVFGNETSAEPPLGSVCSGYLLILPLCMAGTCLMETLADITSTPGGSRCMLIDRAMHLDSTNLTSRQLAWIIEKVDYIAQKVGLQWAAAISQLLSGQLGVQYNIDRSKVVNQDDSETYLLSESGATSSSGPGSGTESP